MCMYVGVWVCLSVCLSVCMCMCVCVLSAPEHTGVFIHQVAILHMLLCFIHFEYSHTIQFTSKGTMWEMFGLISHKLPLM